VQPVDKHNLRSNKGGLWQTIKRAIRVMVVNKAEARDQARATKAADKVAVKRAASKAATAETID
jgi:hypothetical protein